MLAVHFGAGNIGRGFIGSLLYQANYHTTFVDVNEAVIQELNEKQQYHVVLAAEDSEKFTVKNVSGINSISDPEKVVDAISKADIVTTAVGPNILAMISEFIAKGLRERIKSNQQPLNIIACENMVGGSTLLKEKVFEHITKEEQPKFNDLFGFPDAAVDRIVPNQVNEDPLEVSVEPYYEWVVEESSIEGDTPPIDGITFVNDLKPYIERKLFTVNTGHAVPAYIGHYMGYATINEAMNDQNVQEIIKGALTESGEALIQTYQFDREKHQTYINKIIKRFMNPYISDEVTRVGRGPIRKLGPNDRLIRPATMYMEVTNKEPVYLAKTIAAALEYKNEQDEEAAKLQEMVEEQGYEKTLQSVSQLEADHPLAGVVLEEIEELTRLRK
ncbi:mannitol-1-phosphate 5-dehydrogenase [Virgibacillus profundi]|uniref:Mannitol-1-phosphate 5-dehydrogenase n=1 Tax=Virgibacillus profundi TaxID=2024555 RepID=A0A2A2IIX0_9BACI|nr:mannitol-1-phosphate 5-dehydrogenase [Virgibacillus profundi]PAV31276.1 mannitol-1-phosphate 5-dehydrogenase [Virgibacillus profundi]PXY55461.1 mannitol-1-phosphate 5-dehydrogenase [Virgibacillus profundi]